MVVVSVIGGLLGFGSIGTARASSIICVQADGSLQLPGDLLESTDADAPTTSVPAVFAASIPDSATAQDQGSIDDDADDADDPDDSDVETTTTVLADSEVAAPADGNAVESEPAVVAPFDATAEALPPTVEALEAETDSSLLSSEPDVEPLAQASADGAVLAESATTLPAPESEVAGAASPADETTTSVDLVDSTSGSTPTPPATETDIVDSNDLLSVASQMDAAALASCDDAGDDSTMLIDGLSEEDLMLSIASLVEDETAAYASTPSAPRTYGVLIQRPTLVVRPVQLNQAVLDEALESAPTTVAQNETPAADLVIAAADEPSTTTTTAAVPPDELDSSVSDDVVVPTTAIAAPAPTIGEVAPTATAVAPAAITTATRPVSTPATRPVTVPTTAAPRPRPVATVRTTAPATTTAPTTTPATTTSPETTAVQVAPTTTAAAPVTTIAEVAAPPAISRVEPQQIDLRKIFAQPRVGEAEDVAIGVPDTFDQFGTIEFRPNRGRLGAVWILWLLATMTIIGLWIPGPIRNHNAPLNSSIPRHRR